MISKNKLMVLLLVLILALSFTACGKEVKENVDPNPMGEGITEYPLEVVDSYQREVTIESEPMRVISVAPSITETIFALGVGDKLVGRTEFCNYPEEVKNVESIGDIQDPSIEKIIDLNPDLVIASTHFKEEVLKKLEEAGVKVLVLYGEENFDGVYEVIQKVGQVVNKKEKADNVVLNMKNRVQKVVDRVTDLDKPEIYYVVGFGEYGDFTAGQDTFIANMIEMAGGKNSAGDVKGWKYSLEKLVEKDPDMLICSMQDDTKNKLIQANGYKDLTAVKDGKVFEINKDILELQGPRLIDGLEALAEIIHPIK